MRLLLRPAFRTVPIHLGPRYQPGLHLRSQAGSLSGFHIGLLLLYLLDARKISLQMGAYHMLRVVLRFLATVSLRKVGAAAC